MKYSLQHKILLAFSIVTFIGLSSLLLVTCSITENNVRKNINKDMVDARKNLDIYLRQFFLIGNMEMDSATIQEEADNISTDLSGAIGSTIILYDQRGINLSSSLQIEGNSREDLLKAIGGQTAYTINHMGRQVIVNLSYPVIVNGRIIGIIRYSRDYSRIYEENRNFESIIETIAIGLFVFILLTSFILSIQITKPLRMLIEGTEQIYTGDYELNIDTRSNDEIGELVERFKRMGLRIKEQFSIIERDRNALKESQAQNKAFFDNATHELKTPMTTILGYAQILKDNGFQDKDFFDKGTSYIISESERMNRMIIEILELSTSAPGISNEHFEKVELNGLIARTCEEMSLKGKKYNISVEYELEEHLTVIGDDEKLKEVMINLIDNSIKYGRVNSTILVKARRESEYIVVNVIDEGDGIEKEHISHIFDPFYRVSKKASREKGSAGLGLTIVKSILDLHSGEIEFRSEPGVGTDVELRLREGGPFKHENG